MMRNSTAGFDKTLTQFNPQIQVDATLYRPSTYLSPKRLASIGWQLKLLVDYFPKNSVLEVGTGNGLTRKLLTEEGYVVSTLDIDPLLQPDIVGSINAMPLGNDSYDALLCCEVLEHVPWVVSQEGLRELHRVCRRGGVISVPSVNRLVALSLFGPVRDGFRTIKIPQFLPSRRRNEGEHYWELGAGVAERTFRKSVQQAGFEIVADFRPITWFYHHFFVLKKS